MTTFGPIFVPAAIREAVSDAAWFAAMLDAERALASVEACLDVIPAEAAPAIAEQCELDRFDLEEILEQGRAVGNPVEPLVRALRERVGGAAGQWVHHGATSQDVLDTAAMLVARRATVLLLEELDAAAAACVRLAEEHRETPMAGRTLLQQAVPTTFGAKAAAWLVALQIPLERLRAYPFLAQLGGAAGTLAPLGDRGPEVAAAFAEELDLQAPPLPWHAVRDPWAELGALLERAAQACAKVGFDVVLLAQTEIGEIAETDGGGSSTMPHKRNPVHATLARACARIVHANAGVLASGEHELERGAGAWHAEWTALTEALAHAGGAAAAIRECLERLEVFPERMRENMRPELYSERDRLGIADTEYLGSARAFVDAALARRREGG
ncbi:MAG TPA: lyase family protein [Gaiellaceae bacterium]|nr:lyase family protein [Gaiellaceae bacterium]